MAKAGKISTIIFDLDGVLIDATEWHYEALNKSLGLFGFKIGPDEHMTTFNGLPTAKKLEILTRDRDLPKGLHEPIKAMKKKFTETVIANECNPDFQKQIMLKNLKKKDYKLACCSNAIKESVVDMLTRAGLIDYFDLVMGNDEVVNPKPDPEIYIKAFKALKVKPEECVIIEDAPHGIKAARASGAIVIPVKGFHDVNLSLFLEHKLV